MVRRTQAIKNPQSPHNHLSLLKHGALSSNGRRRSSHMPIDWIETAQNPLVIAVVISLVIAGVTKGAIGVGMPTVAIPLLALFIDIKAAVVLLTIPLILSNIPQALEGGKTTAAVFNLWPVLAGMVPGLLAGAYLLMNNSI